MHHNEVALNVLHMLVHLLWLGQRKPALHAGPYNLSQLVNGLAWSSLHACLFSLARPMWNSPALKPIFFDLVGIPEWTIPKRQPIFFVANFYFPFTAAKTHQNDNFASFHSKSQKRWKIDAGTWLNRQTLEQSLQICCFLTTFSQMCVYQALCILGVP